MGAMGSALTEPGLLRDDQTARAQALETQGSFIVQAPAGSGKTELLTQRFLKLLGVVDEPEQILAITFTRAATAEMRDRVLDALRNAQLAPQAASETARAALKNDRARGWKLLEQPQRLNIQTIDSLCLTIASETPLLSRLGGSLTPTEQAAPLYALAARRTLARLGGANHDLSAAIRALLELRETSLGDCEQLIAGILAQRDQWGFLLSLGAEADWSRARNLLEAPFKRAHDRVIARAHTLFSNYPATAAELLQLLGYACDNLAVAGIGSEVLRLRGVTQLEQFAAKQHWDCVCEFLLTKGNTWRVRINKYEFPPGKAGTHESRQRERFNYLIKELDREPQFLKLLCELRSLPPAGYSPEQWMLLQHVLLLLRYAVAELRVIFAERNVVDFVELGLAARQVLRHENEGLPASLARRWPHLLVDEFQDTSRGQYELLALLIDAWEAEGSCFLVGDPMQSIYSFRQAEVELFERTRRHGLGEGPAKLVLHPLQLQMNFRSHAGLVGKLNKIFAEVFASSPGGGYQVAFAPSIANATAPKTTESVYVAAQFLRSDASQEQVLAARRAEADEVVRVIHRHCPQVEAAAKQQGEFRIAVLVRAKDHLTWIAKKLREAAIPFRAVEIEQLGQRQEVLDLTALVRSLLQPMDRIAWLTVLRAPWCGLTLRDLHILCGGDERELAGQPVLQLLRMRTPLLSIDGRQRASRVTSVMEDALRGKHRQVSFSQWTERVWRTLGGRECVDGAGYENARAFFHMLEDLPPDGSQLDQQLDRLFAQPDPRASERCGVQLMTIHKSKGLGFDVVIVPGLHRQITRDRQSLLTWLERTTLEGPEEVEQHEFLAAPIGRKGADTDPLYRWISQQRAQREAEEAKRLLYVACTRASRELHLLGTATVKIGDDGSESLAPGRSGSLLKTAWPALESIFQEIWESHKEQAANPKQAELPFPAPGSTGATRDAGRETLQLRRLPVDWEFSPAAQTTPSPRAEEENPLEGAVTEVFGRPSGSLKARAVGVAVHALLEELTHALSAVEPGVLASRINGWRPRAIALLRHAGLPRAEAEEQSAKVVQALRSTLEDANGRWILTASREAETEASWSAWLAADEIGGRLKTLRGDRIFRAGSEPGSREETHLWIVDYKTAQHSGTGLDKFLAEEKQKYQRQLENYGRVLRRVHGEAIPLRLALYYPLLKRLLWWEDES